MENNIEPRSVLSVSDRGVFSLACFACVREKGEIWCTLPLAGRPLLTLEEGIKEPEHELEEDGKGPHFLRLTV